MSEEKKDFSSYNRCFDYTPATDEITILNVNDGKNKVTDVAYDSDNQVMWVKDDVTTFKFKDKVIKIATVDRNEWVVFSLAESKIKDFVMRKLGYPVVRLELTLQQYRDSIDETIEELAPWVVQPTYITVDTSSQIDLSEYNVDYIIRVLPAENSNPAISYKNGGVIDIFATGYYATPGYRDALYRNIELGLIQRIETYSGGGNGNDVSWTWMDQSNQLMVDVGSTNAKRITIEYSPKIRSIDDLTEEIYLALAKKFALAFTRATLSDIRGKFKVDGAPVELDASEQSEKSNAELERLRQELKDTVSTHFCTD